MYRARRSMYLKSRFPRVNGIVTPRVTGNVAQTRNIANFNSTLQGANIKVPNLINKPNRTSSIMATTNGNAWLKDQRDRTLPWRNIVHDIQMKPLVQIESACNSTSSYPQIRNIYNQISVNNVRVPMDFNKDIRRFNEQSVQTSDHNENNKIMLENFEKINFPGTSKGINCIGLNSNAKSFNPAEKKLMTSFSEVLKGCTEINYQDKLYNNQQVKASASLPSSVFASENSKRYSNKNKNLKYIFDTANPLAFKSNGTLYTFGDFDDFEEELQISTPIRNPRDPPCDQNSCSTKTDDEPISNLTMVSDDTQPSLEERLKQQIKILKAGQLSVNQLYILDLVEDLLIQHESYLNDQTVSRRIGFLDNNTKNKQLVKCLENSNALEEDIPSNSTKSKTSAEEQIGTNIIDDQTESVGPLSNMLISPKEKKKKQKKKKTVQSVAQSLKNGEKIKVEVELQLNQRLYEIREVRPKTSNENEAPQSIYFMKEIRVVENDLYEQLAEETVNSEGESNGLHQISDETTERVDKILKASRPLEEKDGPEDTTNWIDEFTYAHIRHFLEEPKNESRKRIKKNSMPQCKKPNENGNYNDCNKTGNERVSCVVKRATPVERPKNKKKIGKKSSQRR